MSQKHKGTPRPEPPQAVTDRAWMDRAAIDLQEAAKIFGISRGAAYSAAKAGEIEVLKFGRRMVVPVTWMKKRLGLDAAA
jgi:hypothetical protein